MLKMNETSNIYSNFSNETTFRLHEINSYFNTEILERKIMSKKLSKYIAALDCFYKTLVVLSATIGEIFIISFASIIGAPVGIARARFSLIFSLATIVLKKLLRITRYKKGKHNKKRLN